MDIYRIISIIRNLKESEGGIPANNASSGGVAGLPPDDPPVDLRRRKRPPVLARGLLGGARTRFKNGWTPNKNGKS